MKRFAIVTGHPRRFATLANALADHAEGIAVSWYLTGAAALEAATEAAPDLVVVDEDLSELSALDFLRRLMAVNAMIHTAVASPAATDQFHDTYEGLGILMQLPAEPDREVAKSLIDRFQALQV